MSCKFMGYEGLNERNQPRSLLIECRASDVYSFLCELAILMRRNTFPIAMRKADDFGDLLDKFEQMLDVCCISL